MMQVIIRMSREKGVVDDADLVNITVRAQGVTEGPMCHSASLAILEVGTLHYPIPPMVNTIPETCLPLFHAPMPSEGVYTYPYIHPSMVPSPPISQAEINLGILFTQFVHVQSSEEQKEQERKGVHDAIEKY